MKECVSIDVRVPGPYGAHWESAVVMTSHEACQVADHFVYYDLEGGYTLYWAGHYILVWDEP